MSKKLQDFLEKSLKISVSAVMCPAEIFTYNNMYI